MPKSAVLLGLLALAVSFIAAFQSADSDSDWAIFTVIFGAPAITTVGFFAFTRSVTAIRSGTARLKMLVGYSVGVTLLSLAIYGGTWHWLHPSNIHYEFAYGQSGSWQAVQFTHTEHGREIDGPWVGAWPVRVRFPDINHDGYPDIRVTGDEHQIAEYLYLPHNDGKHFWHLLRAKGFAVSYPPDGQSYP